MRKIALSWLKSIIFGLFAWLFVAVPSHYVFGFDAITSHKTALIIGASAFFIIWIYEGKRNEWFEKDFEEIKELSKEQERDA